MTAFAFDESIRIPRFRWTSVRQRDRSRPGRGYRRPPRILAYPPESVVAENARDGASGTALQGLRPLRDGGAFISSGRRLCSRQGDFRSQKHTGGAAQPAALALLSTPARPTQWHVRGSQHLPAADRSGWRSAHRLPATHLGRPRLWRRDIGDWQDRGRGVTVRKFTLPACRPASVAGELRIGVTHRTYSLRNLEALPDDGHDSVSATRRYSSSDFMARRP
jgi:hypothetical protein